jgi:adenylate cyclase
MNLNNEDFRILVVDDTLKNIQVLGTILKQEQYQINVAQNGLQALEVVSNVTPDLILLDVMMPELDGFETCKALKKDPATADIPVIFLTAKVETEDIVHGFEIGAVDYVTKPFNPAELLSRVNTHLQLKATREKLAGLATKLSRYLSPQVYDSIFSGEKEVKIESYQRQLTVFFSDIVEFTPRVEAREPDELTAWLNTYLNEMASIALKYGGTLDKFIGDAVMVFFGDPMTLGEKKDAISCVKMAIEMRDKAKELEIPIRVGISTGECTVGNFGSEDRMDYTIIGKEVNTAARLEKNSEPGRILISDETFQQIKDEIPCDERGVVELKGIDRSVTAHWVKDATA